MVFPLETKHNITSQLWRLATAVLETAYIVAQELVWRPTFKYGAMDCTGVPPTTQVCQQIV